MALRPLFVFLCVSISLVLGSEDGDSIKSAETMSVMLEQSIATSSAQTDAWAPRASVTLTVHQFRGIVTVNLSPIKSSWTSQDIKSLTDAANHGGFYRLRLPATPSKPDGRYVSASVPACALLASDFQEELVLHLDSTPNIISMSYSTPVAFCNKKVLTESKTSASFNMKVSIDQAVPAPKATPQVTEKRKAEGKPVEEQQSFFRKYWWAIALAVLVFSMGGGGGGGDAAAGAGAAGGRAR
eukprot:GILK01010619.1.p1 GENE.GILK01010619.1~~GILK01010619.1.p1  ORF type:complete len:256 (+),score=43.87 GILK01010619.1:48-770(+)